MLKDMLLMSAHLGVKAAQHEVVENTLHAYAFSALPQDIGVGPGVPPMIYSVFGEYGLHIAEAIAAPTSKDSVYYPVSV